MSLLSNIEAGTWQSRSTANRLMSRPWQNLTYGGDRNDTLGFINLWPRSVSESGDRNDYVVFNSNGGKLRGWLAPVAVTARSEFAAHFGFLDSTPVGASVIFEVWARYMQGGELIRNRVLNCRKQRDGEMIPVSADLSFLAGRDVTLELSFETDRVSALNIYPILSDPRINERTSDHAQPTRFLEIKPVRLDVQTAHENAGGGDDPMLAALYFRTEIGRYGSTVVEVLDLLSVLAENLDDGSSVVIDESASLVVRDIGLQSSVATLMTVVFVAFEEDRNGRSVIRDTLAKTADAIQRYLIRTAERDQNWVIVDTERFARGIVLAANEPDLVRDDWDAFLALVSAPPEDGTGEASISIETGFKEWFFRGHDYIGLQTVSFLTGPFAGRVSGSLDTFPILPIQPAEHILTFNGKGAVWRVTLGIDVVQPNFTLTGNAPPRI